MTVFLKYFSARFPLCTAQYQEHFTKCLLNEVNKCKTSVPHFKVGHIFVFFNKRWILSIFVFVSQMGLSVNRWEFLRECHSRRMARRPPIRRCHSPVIGSELVCMIKVFQVPKVCLYWLILFFSPPSIIPSSPSHFGIACTCKMGWDESPVREQCISRQGRVPPMVI